MIRSGPREIGDGVVRLREVTWNDAAELYRWRMDPVSRPMFRNTGVVSYDAHLQFLERYFQPDNDDRWFVIEDGTGPVGAIAIIDIQPDGRGELARLVIDPPARGQGYAHRAHQVMIAYARAIGLTELHSEVLSENGASLHVNRVEGFSDAGEITFEGRRYVKRVMRLTDE